MPSNETILPRLKMRDFEPQEKNAPETPERLPQWYVGDEEPPAMTDFGDHDPQSASDDEQDHPELFRAGKIDAYLRYMRMQPLPRDNEPTPLRRPSPMPRAPRREQREFRDYREPGEEHFFGHQPRPIRRPSQRLSRLPTRSQHHWAREIVIAAALSVAVGSLTALVVYDRTSGGSISQALLSPSSGMWDVDKVNMPIESADSTPVIADETAESTSSETVGVVSKKPVTMALLDVQDAAGMASSLIPLSLRADTGVPGQDLAFRLSGLPENAYLTAGTRLSPGAWMLKPGEELGVKLVVPPGGAGQFAIAVEAIEPSTGDLAAPMKEMTIQVRSAVATQILPAGAAASVSRNFNLPETKKPPVKIVSDVAAPIPSPIEKVSVVRSDAAQGLLRSGDKLMGLGDLTSARQFYAKALEQGVTEAAFKLGQTYDPSVFAEKNVQGLKPDPALAMKFYLQAQASGIPDASQSINGLQSWMQK